ncbi:MAG: hypothetical protein WKF97_11415 [Chitinophagaceae bacterium]
MSQILLFIIDTLDNAKEISFCVSDMQDWLIKKGFRGYDSGAIRRVLQDEWKLQPSANSNSYQQYRLTSDGRVSEYTQKGRFYKLSEKEIIKLNNLDDFDDKLIIT